MLADHGYYGEFGVRYDTVAAEDAWRRSLKFLDQTFQHFAPK